MRVPFGKYKGESVLEVIHKDKHGFDEYITQIINRKTMRTQYLEFYSFLDQYRLGQYKHNDISNFQSIPIVSIGKYSGQPVTELIQDAEYMEFMKTQSVWRQNNPELYEWFEGYVPKEKLKKLMNNVNSGRKLMRNMLRIYKENDMIKNDVIHSLLKYHPEKNLDQLEYVTYKRRPPYNELALYYKCRNMEKEDDISSNLCIQNLFGLFDKKKLVVQDVKHAFRTETFESKRKTFFLENTQRQGNVYVTSCKQCKRSISTENQHEIHVDHYSLPFSKILDDFMKKEKIDEYRVKVHENQNREIRLTDRTLA